MVQPRRIAQKISDVLTEAGLSTDILPINDAKYLVPYKAIILGSAVFRKFKRACVFTTDPFCFKPISHVMHVQASIDSYFFERSDIQHGMRPLKNHFIPQLPRL